MRQLPLNVRQFACTKYMARLDRWPFRSPVGIARIITYLSQHASLNPYHYKSAQTPSNRQVLSNIISNKHNHIPQPVMISNASFSISTSLCHPSISNSPSQSYLIPLLTLPFPLGTSLIVGTPCFFLITCVSTTSARAPGKDPTYCSVLVLPKLPGKFMDSCSFCVGWYGKEFSRLRFDWPRRDEMSLLLRATFSLSRPVGFEDPQPILLS